MYALNKTGFCYNAPAMKAVLISVFACVLLVLPVSANQDGVIVRSSFVYNEPSIASGSVGELVAGSRVSIFSRRGGWKEVFSEEQALVGWIRGYQVREGNFAAATSAESDSDSRGFLAGLASFSRKASGFFSGKSDRTSEGTATIGVRGLSEDQIKSAQPDFDEFEKMQTFVSDKQRLASFASKGKLSQHEVTHLEVEKPKTDLRELRGEK